MQILSLKCVDSTQTHLKNLLKNKELTLPFAVVSEVQTNGLGSRENTWQGLKGNLFLSFAIPLSDLPSDLKIESSSIYFSALLHKVLLDFDSKSWLKWPNDFYVNKKKVGGMITNIVGTTLVCGVGLNLVDSPKEFTKLDVTISKEELLKKYFQIIEKKLTWKQVFSKYKIEFYRNQDFFTHTNNMKINLGDTQLQSDGSILFNNIRIYSTR